MQAAQYDSRGKPTVAFSYACLVDSAVFNMFSFNILSRSRNVSEV